MTASVTHEPKLIGATNGEEILGEDDLDAVTGGCVLVEPGPKGSPVPAQPALF